MIEIREVTKVYQMGEIEVHALQGISLDVARGEWVVITGPSGSGKSTLMYIIGCLDVPTSGSYRLNGSERNHMHSFSRAQVERQRGDAIRNHRYADMGQGRLYGGQPVQEEFPFIGAPGPIVQDLGDGA